MVAPVQSAPDPRGRPGPPVGAQVEGPTWAGFVDAFVAADPTLHRCVRQAITGLPSYRLAEDAWVAGYAGGFVRILLLRAFIELLS